MTEMQEQPIEYSHVEPIETEKTQEQKLKFKSKRDIIRFNGEKPTAINLEHLNTMYLEGKKITFDFYSKSQFVEFEDEKAASSVFDIIINTWSSEFEK